MTTNAIGASRRERRSKKTVGTDLDLQDAGRHLRGLLWVLTFRTRGDDGPKSLEGVSATPSVAMRGTSCAGP